jgi:hypothetical protein
MDSMAKLGRRPSRRFIALSIVTAVIVIAGLVVSFVRSAPGQFGSTSQSSPTPVADRPAAGKTVYVAKNGRSDATGSEQDPLPSITAAVSKSKAGGTIVVAGGRYHEELKIENRPGLTITARAGETVWLDGTAPVTNWVKEGNIWVAAGWRTEFDHSPTYKWGAPDNTKVGWAFLNPRFPMAAHPDQVWVDNAPQRQVASEGEVTADTFFVDYDNRKLYLGSDPTDRSVRASTLTQALRIRSPFVTVRGIGVRRYAPSVPHMGAVTVEADDATLDHVDIIRNATTGLHVMAKGATLRELTVEENGMLGITATGGDDLELDRVIVRRNNTEHFNPSPAAGGVKIGRTTGVKVYDSAFERNEGTGLWFDESVYDVEVFRSSMIGNGAHGLSLELSGKADIVGNVIADNAGNGAKINDANDVRLWNNTFVGSDRPINVAQDDRDLDAQGSHRDASVPATWQTHSVQVRNNIIAGSAGNCLLCVEDFSGRWTAADMDVTALGNIYWRPASKDPKWLVVWSRGAKDPHVFRNLSEFRNTVAQEAQGTLFTGEPVLSGDYRPTSAVTAMISTVAQPLPADLAAKLELPDGTQHLGIWQE